MHKADDKNDLVSVVIGCYNQAPFLSEAIESCLKQSHPHVEVVVVDDGSTDETRQVVQDFADVLYVYQDNQGVSTARNRGLRESRAAYVIFLDGDDRLLPDAIECGLERFRADSSIGCAVGRYRKINTEGSPLGPPNKICGNEDFYGALLKSNVIGMLGTMLFRRTALDKIGGFDRRFRASEDYDVALRIAREYRVLEHEHLVAEYRWHDRNMSLDYCFLLKDVLGALKAQWPYARTNAVYKEAFWVGRANWRRLYSSLLFSSVIKETKRKGFHLKPLQQVIQMTASDPATIPLFAARAWEWLRPSRSAS